MLVIFLNYLSVPFTLISSLHPPPSLYPAGDRRPSGLGFKPFTIIPTLNMSNIFCIKCFRLNTIAGVGHDSGIARVCAQCRDEKRGFD